MKVGTKVYGWNALCGYLAMCDFVFVSVRHMRKKFVVTFKSISYLFALKTSYDFLTYEQSHAQSRRNS